MWSNIFSLFCPWQFYSYYVIFTRYNNFRRKQPCGTRFLFWCYHFFDDPFSFGTLSMCLFGWVVHLALLLARPYHVWQDLPWRIKVWFTSSRISHPSTIILSTARFLRIFSVSLTSSCIIWRRQNEKTQFQIQRKHCNWSHIYQCQLLQHKDSLITKKWFWDQRIHHCSFYCSFSINLIKPKHLVITYRNWVKIDNKDWKNEHIWLFGKQY